MESLLSLSHVWQVPQAGAVEEERQPAAQKVRRAGSTCARWTVAEEQRLTEAVTELGERAWGDVAARINAENPARGRVAERSVSSVEQHWQVMTGRRQVKRPRKESIAGMPPPAPAAALAGMPSAASAAALVGGLNAAPPQPPRSAQLRRRRRQRRSPACRRRGRRAAPFAGTGEGEEVAIPNGGVARATSCAHWAPVDAPLTGEVGRSRGTAAGGGARREVEQREVDWHLTTAAPRRRRRRRRAAAASPAPTWCTAAAATAAPCASR